MNKGELKNVGKTFQVEAILDGISSLKDGGLSLRFHTQEISPESKLIALLYQGAFGWLLFSEVEIKESDIPKNEPEYKQRTQSQRIRAILYRMYLQMKSDLDFETFYKSETEKYINYLKAKINS